MIKEGVSEEEAFNTTGIKYMYSKSSKYREMAIISDKVYLSSYKFMFSKLMDREKSYERWVFAVDKKATLNLDVSYNLQEGSMGVYIVSPEGKIVYENKSTANFNEKLKLDLDKGLYSVILVNNYSDQHRLSGSQNIQGNIVR